MGYDILHWLESVVLPSYPDTPSSPLKRPYKRVKLAKQRIRTEPKQGHPTNNSNHSNTQIHLQQPAKDDRPESRLPTPAASGSAQTAQSKTGTSTKSNTSTKHPHTIPTMTSKRPHD